MMSIFLSMFILTVVMQLSCFLVAFSCKFDKITDLAGCLNFIIIAVVSLLVVDRPNIRAVVATILVCISRTELGAFLLYRVITRGKDDRFDAIREKFCYFLVFWIWQILWVYVVSTSLIFINGYARDASGTPLGLYDYIGWAVFAFGFVLQAWSDIVKFKFRSNNENSGKICMEGPWKWSRHPNFCGEIMMWWGLFFAGVPIYLSNSPTHYIGFATVVSPLFTMLVLLLGSGIPQAEGANAARWYDGDAKQAMYESYFQTTPPLWVFPPSLYQKLPESVKLIICFEFPSYKYQPGNLSDNDRSSA